MTLEPQPTFWPAALALGLLFMAVAPTLWYLPGWVLLLSGSCLVLGSIGGWLKELRTEVRSAGED